jgi:hypothetical protein
METQKNKGCDVKNHKGKYFELIYNFRGKIVKDNPVHHDLRTMTEFGFDIEIHEMDHQEHENDHRGVDHELGEEGGIGVVGLSVAFGPGYPVLDLQDQGIDNMQQESSKQDDLKYLDQNIGGHEMCRFVIDHGVLENYYKEVDPHVNQQENNKEDSSQGHEHFLSNGRSEYSGHRLTIKISYLNCIG